MIDSIYDARGFKFGFLNEEVSSSQFINSVKKLQPNRSGYTIPFSLDYNIDSFAHFFAFLENENELSIKTRIESSRNYSKACFSLPTSGTTGKPKLAFYNYRELIKYVSLKKELENIVSLSLIPLEHIGNINAIFEHACRSGSLYFLSAVSHLIEIEPFLIENSINNIIATPSIIKFVYRHFKKPNFTVKKIILGGEHIDYLTANAIISTFPNAEVKNRYGLTEAGIIEQRTGLKNAVKLIKGSYKIESGILYLKKPPYILNKTEWINTGDECIEEKGGINILKRKDFQITLNGFKIDADSIVKKVIALNGVIDAKVSKELLSGFEIEILRLDVISFENQTELKSLIRKNLKETLDAYHVPSKIEFNQFGSTKFL